MRCEGNRKKAKVGAGVFFFFKSIVSPALGEVNISGSDARSNKI